MIFLKKIAFDPIKTQPMNRHNDKLTTTSVGQHRLEKKVIWALGFAWAQVHPPPPKIPNHSST